MSDRNFHRRRRGGMRFRPSGGLNQKPDRSATEARAEATGEKKPEAIFDRGRHDEEIQRAENMPPACRPKGRRPRRRKLRAARKCASNGGPFAGRIWTRRKR